MQRVERLFINIGKNDVSAVEFKSGTEFECTAEVLNDVVNCGLLRIRHLKIDIKFIDTQWCAVKFIDNL